MPVSFTDLKQLRENRAKLVADADTILVAAKGDNGETREFSPEDEAKFDAIHTDAAKLAKEIQRMETQYDAERSIGDHQDHTAEEKGGKAQGMKRELSDEPKGTKTAEADTAAIAQAQTRAFEDYLRTGDMDSFNTDELRDLMTTTDNKGGYAVPELVYDKIILPIREIEAVRRAGATVITVDESGPYSVPYINDTHDGDLSAEGAPDSDVDPLFGQANLQDYRFDSDAIPVTNQMLLGRNNLEQLLYRILRQRIARQMQKKFTNGTGNNEPKGVAVAATAGITAAATNAITYGDLVGLKFSVPQSYRNLPSFAYMMSDTALGFVQKLVGTDGHPIFAVSTTPGAPDTLLGRPVIENSEMPTVAAGNSPIVVGAFEHYIIKDVKSTRIIRDPYTRANKDEVVFHGFHNAGGDLADPLALRKLTMAAS